MVHSDSMEFKYPHTTFLNTLALAYVIGFLLLVVIRPGQEKTTPGAPKNRDSEAAAATPRTARPENATDKGIHAGILSDHEALFYRRIQPVSRKSAP
ncbi:hypothetical protein KKF84_22085 [Myxococcota bacterium]|nr:hypothetical protein [Myxococcota bacterium]MBU1538018.1 hypothetical protein [Myxococcota bacterium]